MNSGDYITQIINASLWGVVEHRISVDRPAHIRTWNSLLHMGSLDVGMKLKAQTWNLLGNPMFKGWW